MNGRNKLLSARNIVIIIIYYLYYSSTYEPSLGEWSSCKTGVWGITTKKETETYCNLQGWIRPLNDSKQSGFTRNVCPLQSPAL